MVLVVLLQIGAKNLTVDTVYQHLVHTNMKTILESEPTLLKSSHFGSSSILSVIELTQGLVCIYLGI